MKSLIEVRNVSKDFELGDVTVHALRNVSFQIRESEMIVILGPSGSGKSTLLNILGGIETATSGEVFYKGEPINWSDQSALSDYRRAHVGFVFQFYNLMPGLTALENVELAAEMVDDPLDPKRLIDQVGLADRAGHFPSKLSGGQQQRIAIARALAKNPDILLCDEPTGALDSKTGGQILRLLHDFNKTYKKAVVIITHNQNIARLADRVFSFKDGYLTSITVNEKRMDPEELEW